jgi:hypothetical protein
MRNGYPGTVESMADLFAAYSKAAKRESRVSTNARIDVRVPLQFAEDILIKWIDIDEFDFEEESLWSFPAREWWCVIHG